MLPSHSRKVCLTPWFDAIFFDDVDKIVLLGLTRTELSLVDADGDLSSTSIERLKKTRLERLLWSWLDSSLSLMFRNVNSLLMSLLPCWCCWCCCCCCCCSLDETKCLTEPNVGRLFPRFGCCGWCCCCCCCCCCCGDGGWSGEGVLSPSENFSLFFEKSQILFWDESSSSLFTFLSFSSLSVWTHATLSSSSTFFSGSRISSKKKVARQIHIKNSLPLQWEKVNVEFKWRQRYTMAFITRYDKHLK